jgi:hypothetical protein
VKLGNAKGREEELQGGMSSTLQTVSFSVAKIHKYKTRFA